MKLKTGILASVSMMAFAAAAFTTASAPQNGVYRFTFGVSETQDGSIPVPADAVCDVNGTYTDTFSYGFLGTTDDSYKTDVPSNLPTVPHAIDGFKVVKGQKIVLKNATDANGVSCVTGPAASEYLPASASSFEGRYPVRFSMRADERGYYAVTCTVANASATANADVTLLSERCHTHAQHLVLEPGETKTFSWSVELAPNFFKTPAKFYYDNAVNVVVVGENAALASLTVVKQPQQAGKVRGSDVADMNVGRTMWLCDDSTGTDQRCDTPYFTLQNYSGVGSGLSRWAPANLSIRNQGEGGLATGANTHRKSCLLKPGDYLYVEFGHNENSTESYTNNLETYLADANEAGANLVVVSPLERHYSWDSANSKWNRSLQGYAEAGEAWVEAKIAEGATNVAFIDLNKPFADWMNAEIVRINAVNPNVSLRNAIDYYFYSGKGGKVDATHPNNAGADRAAYLVWSNAVVRVAVGEAEGATESQRVQAAVLKGITEGVAASVANDLPWSVTDDIINAGKAPNSYWDATVRAGYDYAKDAAVASVDATCTDGALTLRGVTMRVLNQVNYTKAVIDVVISDQTTTNRYYSYYNYDASGNSSGELVVPEAAGFIDADLGKDDADIASHVQQTLTVPAGAKAYIWFAEANGNTWQVGDNAPCSAIYPLEAWTDACLADSCADASTWETTTQAEITFETVDGEDGISFTSSGANSSGQGKNCGFTRALDSQIASGRIRVSFKARFDDGMLVFALGNTKGTTTWPMEGGEQILTLNGSASVFGSAGPYVTVTADDTPALQTAINAGEWMDVDMILDLDALSAEASVGGSDYRTFAVKSVSHTPYKYFGITLANGKAHAGAIDDVKIVALAPTPQVTVAASANNAAFGSVAINGTVAAEATAFVGSDVALTAVCADADLYTFDHWEDAEGNNVSAKTTLVVEGIAADCAYTAVFREYAHDENRITTWDFSDYAVSEIAATGNQTVDCNGMSIFLQNGDTITGEGIYWANAGLKKWDGTVSDSGRHIEWKAPADGDFSLTFQISAVDTGKSVYPYMCVATNEQSMVYSSSAWKSLQAKNIDTDYTISFSATKGTLYKLYAYYQNRDSAVRVSSATFSCTPTYITATAAVNEANYGSATANGVAAAEVFAGREVTFAATPASSAYTFVNWTDSEGTEVSTDATFTATVSAEVTYTANFAKVSEGAVFTASVNFTAMTGANSVSASSVTYVDIYPFRYYLVGGDSITENGLYWGGTSLKPWNGTVGETGRHIEWTAPADGTVEITFQTSQGFVKSDTGPYLCVATNEQAMTYKSTAWTSQVVGAANTDNVLRFTATAGTLYKIYSYFQNRETTVTITSITYPEVVSLVTLAVANGDATAGAVTVNDAAVDGELDVQKGEYVHLVATPSGANVFAGWENGEGETVSDASDFWLCVEGATSLTATWRTVDTHSFTWNRNVSEGDWNDPANWLYEGVVPATTYPSDAAEDYATFISPATVRLTEAAAAKEVWFNADVTLTGGTLAAQLVTTYNNQGKVMLSNAGFANPNGCGITVSNDMVMAQGTVNWINQYETSAQIYGGFKGTGTIRLYNADNNYHGAKLRGDNREFAGEVIFSGGSGRRYQYWADSKATSSNATWTVESGAPTYVRNADGDMVGGSGTYYFGCYNGTWWKQNYADSYTMEIGALNIDSRIDFYTYAKEPNVTKVGSAKLTLGTQCLNDLNVKGGTVNLAIGTGIDTLTMVADTCLEISGDAAWTAGTVTNLFSYTTLAGAGTLAEQVEVTGLAEGLAAEISIDDKIVKAAIIAVPYTDDESATIAKNQDGSYTVDIAAESAVLTIPSGVTVSEVVVSPDTATVTGVPANATVKVAVSWTDAQETQHSVAYAIVKVNSETGAVSLDEDAVVMVGDEEIALRPQLSDAGDEVSPLDVGETVSVGVKSIPGLIYSLARGTAPNEIDTSAANVVAEEKAISSRVSLVDGDPPSNGAFYKVTVDMKVRHGTF